MKDLVNHPGMQLRDDAADSLERFERDHGVQPLTSAWRSEALQQALIDFWDAPASQAGRDGQGRPLNRPPYLYAPRRPASSGLHVAGTALDTSAPEAFHVDGRRYGWLFLYAYDKVHFEYNSAYDTKPGTVSLTPVGDIMNSKLVTVGTRTDNSVALYNPDTMRCIVGLNDTAVKFHEATGVKWAVDKNSIQARAILNGFERVNGLGAN